MGILVYGFNKKIFVVFVKNILKLINFILENIIKYINLNKFCLKIILILFY